MATFISNNSTTTANSSSSCSSSSDEFSALLPFVASLKSDLPSIDTALKNLMSIVLAKSATYSDIDLLGTRAAASNSTLFKSSEAVTSSPASQSSPSPSSSSSPTSNTPSTPRLFTYSPKEALECAKIFTISLKAFELKSESDFQSKVKVQLADQNAISRLDEILQYRALLYLDNKIKSLASSSTLTSSTSASAAPSSGKISLTKLFGIKYFSWSFQYPLFKEFVLAGEPKTVDLGKLAFFFDEFEKSLTDANSLVWKTDLNAELRLRAAQRQEQAIKRVADLANNEEDKAQSDSDEEQDSEHHLDAPDLHSNSNSNELL